MTSTRKTEQHFLLVDDDETFCAILSRALTRRGLKTSTAHSSAQAISFMDDGETVISHAVLDLNMGTDSGLSLIPLLLQRDDTIKIVVLTGYSSIATTVEAIKRGASNYLCKPASVDEILNAFEDEQTGAFFEVSSIENKPLSVERLEWEYIQKTLVENNGNVSATARLLGMHRRTLQRKLQKKPVRH